LNAFDKPIDSTNFFSTQQFVDYHYTNLVNLFRKIVERCIEVELLSIVELPPVDVEAESKITTFPCKATWSGPLKGFKHKIGPLAL
jgi:hypothetical protein